MYDIRSDARTGTVFLTLRGFWTLDTFHRFSEELKAEIIRLRGRHGKVKVLSDSREFPVQSHDVMEAFAQSFRKPTGNRTAIIVGTMLNKMQAERTLGSPGLRVFLSVEEARAWLEED